MLSEKYVYESESDSDIDSEINTKFKKVNLKPTFNFSLKLISQAKSKGGDRYENDNKEIVIYIPQDYSRDNNTVKKCLNLNVNFNKGLKFKLSSIAKSKGGDKYICESNSIFNIYLPQTISRISNKIQEVIYITIN